MTAKLSPRARLVADAAGRWVVQIDSECTVTASIATEILIDRHSTQFEHLARRWRDVTEAGHDPAEVLGYAAASGRWAWAPPTSPTTTTNTPPTPAGPDLGNDDDAPDLPDEFRIPDDERARGLERIAVLRARIAEMSTPT